MSTIRQEINIIDSAYSAASGSSATSNEVVLLDQSKFNGATFYFEVEAKTSVSMTAAVTLRRKGTITDDATCSIPLSTTSYTLIRSSAFVPPLGAQEYVAFVDTSTGGTKSIKAARIIIIQNAAALTATETQIEVGDNFSTSSTSD